MLKKIEKEIDKAAKAVASTAKLRENIGSAVNTIAGRIMMGGKLVIFGNGGSAADAQHVAAEFVGRFEKERRPFPAIALTVDSSILTAIGNDYGFDKIFSRQVEALVGSNDVVIAISTSGNSENILKAVKKAGEKGAKIIGFTGKSGGKLGALVDILINVNAKETCHVQEGHLVVLHVICKFVEEILYENKKT
ncbi:MAG: SIS domain-containing protein [Candidatus Firestonebacteria bacterium]